jgi:hypothetical protein
MALSREPLEHRLRLAAIGGLPQDLPPVLDDRIGAHRVATGSIGRSASLREGKPQGHGLAALSGRGSFLEGGRPKGEAPTAQRQKLASPRRSGGKRQQGIFGLRNQFGLEVNMRAQRPDASMTGRF